MSFALSSKMNVSCLKARTTRARVARQPMRIQAIGGLGDMGKMNGLMENLKKAQAMVQEKSGKVQAELAATYFDGYDEEETVKIVFAGNQQPKSVELTNAAMDCDADELSRRIEEAMLDAHAKSVEGLQEKMAGLAKELGVPPGMGLPGM